MRQGKIRFTSSIDYDGDCTFDVTVSSNLFETCVHFYGDVDTWKDFGRQLMEFPRNTNASVDFDQSHDYPFPADSFFLKVYCYNQMGHSALKVTVDNHEAEPNRYRLEFSFPAEAASINRFGQLLSSWEVKDGDEIIWEAQTN